MAEIEFELSHVKKSYWGHAALDDVSLEIEKGSMNFLLGANGSGKSTLIKCLAGHLYWNSGEILRFGQSRKKDRADFNRGVHLISEDIHPPDGRIVDLKDLYQSLYQNWDEKLFQRFLAWGNLDETKTLGSVSRGQRIQALFALTIATSPETLLIDEATAVLDPFIRSRLMMELEKLNQTKSMTALAATNVATEITALKGRLLILQKGKVVVDRESKEVARGFRKVLVSAENLDAASKSVLSFIGRNGDGSFSFLGKDEDIEKLELEHSSDQRALSIDEVFIYFSDRKAA